MPKLQIIPRYTIVTKEAEARALLAIMKQQPIVGVDTETTSLDVWAAQLICLGVAWPGPPGVRALVYGIGLVKQIFQEWIENPKYKKAFHNAKYDMHILENHGIRIRGIQHDTFIADWLVDENRQNHHGLKDCAVDHLELPMTELSDFFKEYKVKRFDLLPKEIQYEYGSKDPWATVEMVTKPSVIHEKTLMQVLRDLPSPIPSRPKRTLYDHYNEVEIPFVSVLQRIERRGFAIDRGFLRDLDPKMKQDIEGMEEDFCRQAKRPVNLNSPHDLRRLIYDEMGIKPGKLTKGGKSGKREPSVDKSVLTPLAAEEARQGKRGIFTILNEHRKVSKIHKTYILGLLAASDNPERRAHTSFSSDVVTGRLSSSEPNLQNIPKAKKDIFRIREAFTADPSEPEKALIIFDYEQLEMRIMAHYSGDKKLCGTILSGVDVHSKTAAEMYGLDYDEIMEAKRKDKGSLTSQDKKLLVARDDAKIVGFGIVYGMQAFALSINLGCTPEEAQAKINAYFHTYPGVARCIEDTKSRCREDGHVTTILMRYRRLRDITKGLEKRGDRWISKGDFTASQLRRHAENQAVNTPIQGSAADLAKVAMTRTSEVEGYGDSELRKLGCYLLLQVHDELIYECPIQHIERAKKIIRPILEHPFEFDLKVPLPVDVGTAFTWADAKA